MKPFKFVVVIVVAWSLASVSGCESDKQPEYKGFLYFGAGSYLGKFSLADASSVIVANVGDANIRRVEELYDSRLLLVLDAFENNREVARIAWLDVRTLQDTLLFAGRAGVWVPDVHTYIYDDGSRLSAASTRNDYATDAVILDHRLNDLADIKVISGTAVIFQTGFGDRSELWRYDAAAAELQSLDALAGVCALQHSVWLADRALLACRSHDDQGYVLTSLEGEIMQRLRLPAKREFFAVEHIADQSLIVFSEPWRTALDKQRRNAVWLYNLDEELAHRLVEHQHLGPSTVYSSH